MHKLLENKDFLLEKQSKLLNELDSKPFKLRDSWNFKINYDCVICKCNYTAKFFDKNDRMIPFHKKYPYLCTACNELSCHSCADAFAEVDMKTYAEVEADSENEKFRKSLKRPHQVAIPMSCLCGDRYFVETDVMTCPKCKKEKSFICLGQSTLAAMKSFTLETDANSKASVKRNDFKKDKFKALKNVCKKDFGFCSNYYVDHSDC